MKTICRALFSFGSAPYPSYCFFNTLSLPEAVFGIVTIALGTACIYPLVLEIYYDSTPDPGQVVLNPSASLSAILAGGLVVLYYFLLQLAAHYRDNSLRAKITISGLLWIVVSLFSAICTLRRPPHIHHLLPAITDIKGIDYRVQDILDVQNLINTCGNDSYACAYGAPKLWLALCSFTWILSAVGLLHCYLLIQEIKKRYLTLQGIKQTQQAALLLEEGRKKHLENYETISDHDDDDIESVGTLSKNKKKERYKYLKVSNPLAGILQSPTPLPIHAYSASVVPIPHTQRTSSSSDTENEDDPQSTSAANFSPSSVNPTHLYSLYHNP